jgi:hypothetical protein
LVLNTVDDLVGAFLYYDRKEDKELPRGRIEELVLSGDLTIDDIVAKFRSSLMDGWG